MGDDRDGIIILLSMAERDYAMFVYGTYAETAFNSYGQENWKRHSWATSRKMTGMAAFPII